MIKTYFRYKKHPGDFFRNTELRALPNPDENLEDFLIWFLDHYQSDSRIALIDDLSKLIDDEFEDENDKAKFIKSIGLKSESELLAEIESIENELKEEAYQNFYSLVREGKIEVLANQ